MNNHDEAVRVEYARYHALRQQTWRAYLEAFEFWLVRPY